MTTRDEYAAEMKVKLDVWNVAIEELEAKIHKRKARGMRDFNVQITGLKGKRDEATDKLKEIQAASEDAWGSLQVGAQRIWYDLKQSFQEINEAMGQE